MNLNIKFICFLVLLLHWGCENKPKIEKIDIYSDLEPYIERAEKSRDSIQLEICKFTPFYWDSIYVIPPYTGPDMVRDLGFSNSKQIEDLMFDVQLDERVCVFLFIKGKEIVRYSIVPLMPLNILSLFDEWMSSHWISKKDACSNLYVFKQDTTLKPLILGK
jgi:hypothetical protein